MPCWAMSLCHRLGTELSFSVFLQLLSQGQHRQLGAGLGGGGVGSGAEWWWLGSVT